VGITARPFRPGNRIADAQVFPAAAPAQGKDPGVLDAQDDVGVQTAGDFGIDDGQLQVQGLLVVGFRQVDPPAGRLGIVFLRYLWLKKSQ
jgi:hypothetical protein